jgi:heterodisulfide reductase subunit A
LLLGVLHVRHQGGGDRQGALGALDTAIFYMDMRTYGKDFEKYYDRPGTSMGVRFMRSPVHTIDPKREGRLR